MSASLCLTGLPPCRSVVDDSGTSGRGSWPSQADVRAALSDYGNSYSMPLFVRASMTGVTLGGMSSAVSRSHSDLTASGSGLTSGADPVPSDLLFCLHLERSAASWRTH